jgi:hypothetical protein
MTTTCTNDKPRETEIRPTLDACMCYLLPHRVWKDALKECQHIHHEWMFDKNPTCSAAEHLSPKDLGSMSALSRTDKSPLGLEDANFLVE